MNARTLFAAGLAVSALALLPPIVLAQPAAAPAEAPISQGPTIPGYCVFSLNGVLGGSKVGQAVDARLKVLAQQVNAELQPEATAISTDYQTWQTQQASMDQATAQAKRANLDLRASNFEKLRQQRDQEMQATQNKQLDIIKKQLQPIIRTIYQRKQCSVLIEAEAGGVYGLNPAMDLTPQAVVGLDAIIQTLTFDREHLDEQQAGGAAPGR